MPSLLWPVALPGTRLSRVAQIKVSSIPCCKQRGAKCLQDDRCLQSAGYYSFLCRFFLVSPPSGIAVIPSNGNLIQQSGNREMHLVLIFFAKINRTVLWQLCAHAQSLCLYPQCFVDTSMSECKCFDFWFSVISTNWGILTHTLTPRWIIHQKRKMTLQT